VRASRARDGAGTPPPPPDAFEATVRLLTQRPHSEVELRRKLGRRRCPPEDIDGAVARARGLGYLDDAAFARALATQRARTRGPALIAAELAAKGVDRAVVHDAVSGVPRAELLASARRLAARAAGTDRRVVASRLLRRGFPGDVVREALELEPDGPP
jgi:regulatory protein